MHSSMYEAVVGRHGLVSNGFLLWKVGVKNVYNYEEKLVGFHPHNPHTGPIEHSRPPIVPTNDSFYTEYTPHEPTGLSTQKITQSTDGTDEFYPQSTPPTITTTIYINRRGTAA